MILSFKDIKEELHRDAAIEFRDSQENTWTISKILLRRHSTRAIIYLTTGKIGVATCNHNK